MKTTRAEKAEGVLSDARRGVLPDGAYRIRNVSLDGVSTVHTDTGARRQTAGDHAPEPHFARVTNLPGRGPAWWRLVVDGVAYGLPSDVMDDVKGHLDGESKEARRG